MAENENKEEPRVEGYEVKTLVSPDGRVIRTVTSQDEEDELLNNWGYKEGSAEDTRDREPLNSGAEGNRRSAESSTTRKLNDGVDRRATSEKK